MLLKICPVVHQYKKGGKLLCYLHFHPLEVVSRYRDPQIQVGENDAYVFNFRANISKSSFLNT